MSENYNHLKYLKMQQNEREGERERREREIKQLSQLQFLYHSFSYKNIHVHLILPSLPFKKYLTTYRKQDIYSIMLLKHKNMFFSYQLINIAETNSSLISLQENVQ